MKQTIATTCAAAAMLVATSGTVMAATQDFVVDWANSSVMLTEQNSGGINCYFSNCGVSVALSGASTSFTLGEGDSQTFDFLRWNGTGTTGSILWPDDRNFEVTATLAFAPPVASGSSTGSGGAHIFAGFITAGTLNWDNSPQLLTGANGSVFSLSFEGGSSWLLDGDAGYTSKASVHLVSAVPLPAAAPLLIFGLGAIGVARRRRKMKAA